jgi:hypothetical protein
VIETELDGETAFLLNDTPNFKRDYKVTVRSILDSQEGLTKREARRAYSTTLLFDLNFSVAVTGADLRTLQGQLRSIEDQQVLTPFWPAVSSWLSRAGMKVTGGLLVAFKRDWSQWEVYENGSEPGWPDDNDYVAPLLVGFLKTAPKLFPGNPSFAIIDFDFSESSKQEYALSFEASAFSAGPSLTGYDTAPRLLPFVPTFRGIQSKIDVRVQRESVGFTREQSATFYSHEPWEDNVSAYWARSLSDIASVLYWYRTQSGQGAPFWSLSPLASCSLAIDADAADTSLTMSDVGGIQVNDQLSITQSNGTIITRKVTGIAGDVVTVASAFGVDLLAGQIFRRLSLSKLIDKALKLTFKSPVLMTWTMSLSEVRPEVFVPGDETVGVTIGKLTRRCLLYEFRMTIDGQTYIARLTSHERDVLLNDFTYRKEDVAHGQIKQGLNLDRDETTVKLAARFDVVESDFVEEG